MSVTKGIFTKKIQKSAFLAAGKRTPFGKFGGSLRKLSPTELALEAAKSMISDTNLDPKLIDQVIFTNVVPTTTDTLYSSRHLALKLGCLNSTPGYSINRLCGSGIQGILDARQLIDCGAADCILVAGSENMSNTPHLVYGGRFGTKFGALKNVDLLWDAFTDQHICKSMGQTAEKIAKVYNISKESCDQYSANSHFKAIAARKNKKLDNEIVEIDLGKKKINLDEHMRADIKLADMEKLRPSFGKDGIITAGSASGIVDGASCVLICSKDFCKKYNLDQSIEVLGGSVVGVDPEIMGVGPIDAINLLLQKFEMNIEEIDLFEINEAFASQIIVCRDKLNISDDKLNIWGGAIAIGHPLGATGVRITHTLARQLKDINKTYGIASACIGGGQGISLLIKRHE